MKVPGPQIRIKVKFSKNFKKSNGKNSKKFFQKLVKKSKKFQKIPEKFQKNSKNYSRKNLKKFPISLIIYIESERKTRKELSMQNVFSFIKREGDRFITIGEWASEVFPIEYEFFSLFLKVKDSFLQTFDRKLASKMVTHIGDTIGKCRADYKEIAAKRDEWVADEDFDGKEKLIDFYNEKLEEVLEQIIQWGFLSGYINCFVDYFFNNPDAEDCLYIGKDLPEILIEKDIEK